MNVEDEIWYAFAEACRRWPGVHQGPAHLGTAIADLTMPDVNRLVDWLIVLQERFGCRFHTREMDQMRTVRDLVACVEQKVANDDLLDLR